MRRTSRPIRTTASAAGARRDFVTAMVKGTSPDGAASTIRRFRTRPTSACASTTCAICSPTSRRCRRCRARCAPTTCRFRSTSAARSAAGSSCSSTAKPFKPDASKDAAWNRGAYLVNGPGHCAECHSPRNLLGGIIESQRFAGGPDPERRRLGAKHHAERLEQLVAGGHREAARRPATCRTAIPSAARWARSSPTPASSARRTAPRWRPTSSRCRRSKGRSGRRAK